MSARNIKVLSEEHRIIEYVLDALENLAAEAKSKHSVDITVGRKVIFFLREFADQCHHGKEEEILFKWMRVRNIGIDAVEMLEEEHVSGRSLVGRMNQTLNTFEQNQTIGTFVEDAYAFVAMLRDHIHKEDDGVFMMVDSHLSKSDDEQLISEYIITERGYNRHYKAFALAQEIGAGVGFSPLTSSLIPEISRTFIV